MRIYQVIFLALVAVAAGAQTEVEAGGSVVVLPIVRLSPADADSIILLKAPPGGLTVTDIDCIVDPADAGESVVVDIQECDSTGDSCVTVDAAITCDNDGAADDGTFTNGAVDAGDWVLLDIGTVTGTVTSLSVTVIYDPT